MMNDKVIEIKIGGEALSEGEALSRALKHHKAGDFQKAESIYRKIYLHNPLCPSAPYLSSLIQYHYGDFAPAVKSLKRAVALDGSRPHYHYNLGLILLDMGEKDEAKECFQKALALDDAYQPARAIMSEIES